MRRLIVALIVLLVLLPGVVGADGPRGPKLTVITRNLYVGFDVAPAIEALASGDFVRIITTTKDSIDALRATDFRARAEALADEIARSRPTLIGLQEVALFRTQDPADFSPIPNAATVELDFLETLLAALAARDLTYDPVAVVQNADFEAPALRDDFSCCRDFRLTDRDVILARRGVAHVLAVGEANFVTNLIIPSPLSPGGVFTILRGWVSVDAQVHGSTVRLVNTHLEPFHPGVQLAQAVELLQGPANTLLPLVMLGDFNSRADGTGTPTYATLIASGLADAWDAVHPGDPGYTCCQEPDLRNPTSALVERIDIVFTRDDFVVLGAEVVGEEPADRTASGLWPSDHAGVVSTLGLPRR